MNKKKMDALIDQSLAEKIQLLVNDPDFPDVDRFAVGSAKKLVRGLWMDFGWRPGDQPWGLLTMFAASEIHKVAHSLEHASAGEMADYMLLREFAHGLWDREHALESVTTNPLLLRFQTYGALFGFGRPILQAMADDALKEVESLGCVGVDYTFWHMTQELAA